MLYYLLYPLHDRIPAFNVFRYITFRVAAAIVTALLLSWIFYAVMTRGDGGR